MNNERLYTIDTFPSHEIYDLVGELMKEPKLARALCSEILGNCLIFGEKRVHQQQH